MATCGDVAAALPLLVGLVTFLGETLGVTGGGVFIVPGGGT